jgi:hypothetical protein
VQAFQSFELEYGTSPNPGNPLYRRVVGNVLSSEDLLDFTLEPAHSLKHHGNSGLAPERYLFSVKSGTQGVSDLAGNQLRNALPQIAFTIDPAQPAVDSGGVALDFSALDEDQNGGPEIRGQFLQDPSEGVVNPRAVARFSTPVDRTQPTIIPMTDLPLAKIQTPLSNLGSKTQIVWRYIDMGFPLLDDINHNLDVEGLWWEPFFGTPQLDNFPEFEMRLAHSFNFPDEGLDPGQLPKHQTSGLGLNFDSNYADFPNQFVEEPPAIVHPKAEGYQVQPIHTVSQTGRGIAAWPMNVGKPLEEFTYWTWRDTSKLMRGGPKGVGVDPDKLVDVFGPTVAMKSFYPPDDVPTIGLPMLMEFRTYPSTQSNGQNGFRIAIAINSSANPFFRNFSTGGVLNGQTLIVDPDQQTVGQGGVDPILNVQTKPRDNTFYYGQADFVVRVSRFHTMWLDTLVAGSAFAPAVVEPRSEVLPSGTQVVLAFRGASTMTKGGGPVLEPWENADFIDPYGDSYVTPQWFKMGGTDNSFVVTEFPADNDLKWRSSPALLNGARFVQVRASLISNPISGLSPWISALGLSYLR